MKKTWWILVGFFLLALLIVATFDNTIFSASTELSPRTAGFSNSLHADDCKHFENALNKQDTEGILAYVNSCDRVKEIVMANGAVSGSTCEADLNTDGFIDFNDLLLLLSYWGEPEGDINGDDTTDFDDLLLLLSSWNQQCGIRVCDELADGKNIITLDAVRNNLEGDYLQICDIDLSSFENWEPIGDDSIAGFTGTYNGNGYTISNLVINRPNQSAVGFFGFVGGGEEPRIIDVHLENVVVTGNERVGALIGYLSGSGIVDSSVTSGTITGVERTGGIVGYLNSALFSNSHSSVTVEGTNNYTGGLVGYSIGSDITESSSEGSIIGNRYTGGAVGYAESTTIDQSHSTTTVDVTKRYVGGLVGYLFLGTVNNTYATGNVSNTAISVGTSYTGGLIGFMETSYAGNSYATGNVYSPKQYIGGFAGRIHEGSTVERSFSTGNTLQGGPYNGAFTGYLSDYSLIKDSYATGSAILGSPFTSAFAGQILLSQIINSYSSGSVRGARYVGGLVGNMVVSEIHNSFSTANVTSFLTNGNAGGFIGQTETSGLINNSFFAGPIQAVHSYGGFIGKMRDIATLTIIQSYSAGIADGAQFKGGIVGNLTDSELIVIESHWDQETLQTETTCGNTDCSGGEAHSTNEMMMQSTFENWDFENTWAIDEGESYPYLQWFGPPA